jgi:hypothetical protein
MPRSSESVAALASALAKAQAELTNPEKSLVGKLPAERGQPERTFRYASLSGGLDIVRKTLGRHEIATMQSTAVDRESGTVQLTTTLAHASGEWIASEWPVCALAELPTPHRMGMALTYARRYSLFALVGIAGEDDVDAPDLVGPSLAPARASSPAAHASSSRTNGKALPVKPVALLDPEASVRQRDALLEEIASISSFEAAAQWAKRIIPVKNTMAAEHAREIETALEARLTEGERSIDQAVQMLRSPANNVESGVRPPSTAQANLSELGAPSTSKATPALEFEAYAVTPKTRRRRDKRHRQFVASQACVVCGRQPSDAHHLRFAQPRGLGLKVSDEFTVPLCRSHHRDVHRTRNEIQWWARFGIKPLTIAYKLWSSTHPAAALPKSAHGAEEAVAPVKAVIETSAGIPEAPANNATCETNPIQPTRSL